jgi:hypothetical protein
MKMEQSVPKCWHKKFRRRGIIQKREYNIKKTATVWNQENLNLLQTTPQTKKTPTGVFFLVCGVVIPDVGGDRQRNMLQFTVAWLYECSFIV